ncbi:MFS transporter [Luteitalea sp. TBR-22]|uniref:NTP/NDP exchange transporter n=1 Tax=Luteitalea sp. TBR-22 TaxID=2802971 RepID=UPI001AF79E14|nr:Npt1/Npt2 family nucleotide transporter [Luteitalea sp. TBR-22]BCS33665.1 MFS transporter [Luteitalea sp. TBR-22]
MNDPRTLVSHPELESQQSFPHFRTVGEPPRNALERVLSVFADVRAGEGLGVLLLAVTVFLLLAGYYLLKTAREALILTEGGAEVKAYSSAAQAVLLLLVVPAYGWLASRVARVPLIGLSNAFFAATLLVFASLRAAGTPVGIVFYIWLGIFNVFVISQFWAFANDVYTEGQGRRLFPFIGVGSSLGAWLGAEAAGALVTYTTADPGTLMIGTAALLAVCFGLIVVVNRREVQRSDAVGRRQSDAPIEGRNGFALIVADRYLLLIAALMVLLNIVNTSGEFLLSKLVVADAAAHVTGGDVGARQRYIGAFYGAFFGRVNLLGLLLQLFVTSRLLRAIGVRGALFVLPVLALVNYSVIAVAPVLAVVGALKVLENSTDYSIQNTVRQALFLPTTREAKYKAKAAIDTFFMRLGDVTQALIVRVGTGMGAGVAAFAWLNVALTVAWLALAGQIAREHRRRTV